MQIRVTKVWGRFVPGCQNFRASETWLQNLLSKFSNLFRQKQPTEAFFIKKVFLEISQNSQENICARVSFLIKLQVSGLQLYWKRGSGTGIFLWILRNFKNTFLTKHHLVTFSFPARCPELIMTTPWRKFIDALKNLINSSLHLKYFWLTKCC